MSTLSFIVPFYNGNKHLAKLKTIFESNAGELADGDCIEVVLVNDSPWISVDKEALRSDRYSLKTVEHSQNGGIHQARITGLQHASGEYVTMLDQDDEISPLFAAHMLQAIREMNADCVLCNGYYQPEYSKQLIFNSYGKVLAAKHVQTFYLIGNIIASPGQAILRRDAVPAFWTKHVMKYNCADDLFLWMLMFREKRPGFLNEALYTHVSTGENVSLDVDNGHRSVDEMLDFLSENRSVPRRWIKISRLRMLYFRQYYAHKIDHPVSYCCYAVINIFYRSGVIMTGKICGLFGKKVRG